MGGISGYKFNVQIRLLSHKTFEKILCFEFFNGGPVFVVTPCIKKTCALSVSRQSVKNFIK